MKIANVKRAENVLNRLSPGVPFIYNSTVYMRVNDSGVSSKLNIHQDQCLNVTVEKGELIVLRRDLQVQPMGESVLHLEPTR